MAKLVMLAALGGQELGAAMRFEYRPPDDFVGWFKGQLRYRDDSRTQTLFAEHLRAQGIQPRLTTTPGHSGFEVPRVAVPYTPDDFSALLRGFAEMVPWPYDQVKVHAIDMVTSRGQRVRFTHPPMHDRWYLYLHERPKAKREKARAIFERLRQDSTGLVQLPGYYGEGGGDPYIEFGLEKTNHIPPSLARLCEVVDEAIDEVVDRL